MSTSRVQARKMVLVSALLLAAIAVYKDRRDGAGDTFKALWGVGVVSQLLALLADFAPTVAGPFAVLTVLGSLTSGGTSIIDKLLGTVSSGSTTGARSATMPASAAADAHHHPEGATP